MWQLLCTQILPQQEVYLAINQWHHRLSYQMQVFSC